MKPVIEVPLKSMGPSINNVGNWGGGGGGKKLVKIAYSRLRNKHMGTLINFWTFFQGLHSLLERVMHIFFQNICYFMVWGMPILRATLNIFAKSSRGYVYSGGYVYSRV